MNRVVGLIVAVACSGIGCGDNPPPPPDPTPPPPPALTEAELVGKLSALPNVTVEQGQFPPGSVALAAEFRYYILHVTQPIDHHDPSRGTFVQRVQLLHRDERAPNPMVVSAAGYTDLWGSSPVELTKMLTANQVSIEHRYYGNSRPPTVDWSTLTIEQAAADQHEIIAALRTIYGGAFITTGSSKGGMTAVFHRRFWPNDVDGTVAYSAPLSWSASDEVYQDKLDALDVTPCRHAVRAAATDMLVNHRDELVAKASAEPNHVYGRVAIGPAVEGAISDFEWSYWTYHGLADCEKVPAAGATVDELYAFLEKVSSVTEYDDENVAAYEPYVYQSHTELGYPSEEPSYFEEPALLMFTDADFAGELPAAPDGDDHGGGNRGPGSGNSHGSDDHGSDDPAPRVQVTFDPQVMLDVDDFVEHHSARMMFVYGGGDPWSARPFLIGRSADSAMFIQPDGTHQVQIGSLPARDRNEAFDMLERWTGVAPVVPRGRPIAPLHEEVPRALSPARAHNPRVAK